MVRRAGLICVTLSVVVAGCFPTSETSVIPSSPFGTGTPTAAAYSKNVSAPAATTEAAKNVARVGVRVVSASSWLGPQPIFITLGGDSAPFELFHHGETQVFITETLARQCKTEGQLAALLSTELGKIASERAARNPKDVIDNGPPPAVNIGNEYGGAFGAADGTRMMELAKYERKRALAREAAEPPAPDVLARAYLQKAGYNPAELDAVGPLLRAADGNNKLEKLTSVPPPK